MSFVASKLKAIAQYELDLAFAENMQLREVFADEQLKKDHEFAMVLQGLDDRGYVDGIDDDHDEEELDTDSHLTAIEGKGKGKKTVSFDYRKEIEDYSPAEDYSDDDDDGDYDVQSYSRSSTAQFVCGICFDEFTLTKPTQSEASSSNRAILQGVLLPDCQHPFCIGCLAVFLNMELRKPGFDFPIRCPKENCYYNIENVIAQRVLSNDELEFWWQKKAETSIKNKIYCPNKKCSVLMDLEDPDTSAGLALECIGCHNLFCGSCVVPWHKNMTCEQFQALPLEERCPEDRKIFETAENYHWRRCHKCKNLVELQSGCNHITCLCRAEFCYKCGSEWDTTNQECSSGNCELWSEEYLLDGQERQRLAEENVQRLAEENVQRLAEENMQRQVHRGLDLSQTTHRKSAWLTTMIQSNRCGYCDRDFTKLDSLQSHLNSTTRHLVYHCCGKLFRDEDGYIQHRQSVGCL